MTGTLEHLGGDRYKVRMYAGTDLNGKQRLRSKTFHAPTEQKALRMADGIRAALRKEIEEGAASRDTLAGVAQQWIDLKQATKASPSTLVNYQRHTDRIVARFGKLRPDQITGRHIDAWYSDLAKHGMSDANILHHHTTLRMILRQAQRWGMLHTEPWKQATPPRRQKPEVIPPTTAAVTLIMDSARGDLGAALHVLAATGARRGELVGLQWIDVHGTDLTIARSILTLDRGRWIVKTPKGRKPRTVTLDPATLERIQAHWRSVRDRQAELGVSTPWMFPDFRTDRTGKTPHRPGWLSGEWAKLRARHGADAVRLHDLRHWHASVLVRRGVDFTEIANRLGHAQTSTTMNIYSHLIPDVTGRAAGAIGAELAALTPPERTS